MFDWLRPKPKGSVPLDLAFKSNEAAFKYACAYMRCDVVEGEGLLALVVDAVQTFGMSAPVEKDEHGIQTSALKVASSDGGFLVIALSLGRGPDLKVGDLVAWVPGEYRQDFAATSTDRRFGWVGLIVGTLEPRHVDGSWVGKDRFGSGPQSATQKPAADVHESGHVAAMARAIHEMCSDAHHLRDTLGAPLHRYFIRHPMLKNHRAPTATDRDQVHIFWISDGQQSFEVMVCDGQQDAAAWLLVSPGEDFDGVHVQSARKGRYMVRLDRPLARPQGRFANELVDEFVTTYEAMNLTM